MRSEAMKMQDGMRKYAIQCNVGCLQHVIGVAYMEFMEQLDDEPELYFETLHEPCESAWERVKAAWRFVVHKEPMGVDSTLIGSGEAMRLGEILFAYANEHDEWVEAQRSKSGEIQKKAGKQWG